MKNREALFFLDQFKALESAHFRPEFAKKSGQYNFDIDRLNFTPHFRHFVQKNAELLTHAETQLKGEYAKLQEAFKAEKKVKEDKLAEEEYNTKINKEWDKYRELPDHVEIIESFKNKEYDGKIYTLLSKHKDDVNLSVPTDILIMLAPFTEQEQDLSKPKITKVEVSDESSAEEIK